MKSLSVSINSMSLLTPLPFHHLAAAYYIV
jgi:hypothetical protein